MDKQVTTTSSNHNVWFSYRVSDKSFDEPMGDFEIYFGADKKTLVREEALDLFRALSEYTGRPWAI